MLLVLLQLFCHRRIPFWAVTTDGSPWVARASTGPPPNVLDAFGIAATVGAKSEAVAVYFNGSSIGARPGHEGEYSQS